MSERFIAAKLAILLLSLMAGSLFAATPDVEYLFPDGGQQGKTLTVIAGNKADSKIAPWPAHVWTDTPGLEFTPTKNNTFEVTIAADVPLGPHQVRIYNDDGGSQPREFIVGRHTEVNEVEPNDDPAKPQQIKNLPTVVNGALDKPGDVDCFAVDVEAGRYLVAEVECRRLGSPCDPALRLVDQDGVIVAFNHDTYGLDPLIAYRIPKTGRYVLEVIGFPYPPGSDIRFAGSKSIVYRLNLTTGPYARFSLPTCVTRASPTTLHLFGWNIGPAERPFEQSIESTIVPPAAEADFDEQNSIAPPSIDNILIAPLVDATAKREQEPNNTPDQAQAVSLPAAIDGCIDTPGDIDCFAIDAKAAEKFVTVVRAASINSSVDPMVVIMSPDGKELAREIGGGQDIRLEWTAVQTGRHVISMYDISRAGGQDFVYRLEVARLAPDFSVKVDAPTFKLERTKPAKVQLTITKFCGHATPLKVEALDLPDGITSSYPEIPARGGAVTLTLTASPDAKFCNVPLKIKLVGSENGKTILRYASYQPAADSSNLRTNTLWLSIVPPQKDEKPKTKH